MLYTKCNVNVNVKALTAGYSSAFVLQSHPDLISTIGEHKILSSPA